MYTQFSSVRGPTNQGMGDLVVSPIDVVVTSSGNTAVGDLVALPVPNRYDATLQTVGWTSSATCATITAANALTSETRRILGVALTATTGAATLTVRIRGVVSAKVETTTAISVGDILMGVASQAYMVKSAATATMAYFPAMALEARTGAGVGTIAVLFDGIQGLGYSNEA